MAGDVAGQREGVSIKRGGVDLRGTHLGFRKLGLAPSVSLAAVASGA
jgi:hypothetical protein